MPYYLNLDGVDDSFSTPSLTFNTIEMDVLIEHKSGANPYVMSGTNAFVRAVSGLDNISGFTVYLNNIVQQNGTIFVPSNTRINLKLVSSNVIINPITFFTLNSVLFTKAKIWSIKILNNSIIQSYYDFTGGNTQDKSGNGKHGISNGGVFIFESGSAVVAPKPTIVSISTPTYDNTISNQPNMDRATVAFIFDQDVTEWTVNVFGTDHSTGIVADSGGFVAAETEIIAEIDWTELYQENENRINIYGKNEEGQWTPY